MPQFVRVCALKDVPRRRGKLIELNPDHQIALFNVEGTVYAVDNVCPHQHQPVLFEGYVEDCTVTCPLHGWKYDLQTGTTVGGNGAPIRTYQVRIDGEDVLLEKTEEGLPRWMSA